MAAEVNHQGNDPGSDEKIPPPTSTAATAILPNQNKMVLEQQQQQQQQQQNEQTTPDGENIYEQAPEGAKLEIGDDIELPSLDKLERGNSRTNCAAGLSTGITAAAAHSKHVKLSQVGPKSMSLEETKKSTAGGILMKLRKNKSEEKSRGAPSGDGEVEYENMDIVRKLRAALNTSNSNHNNRKIMEYSTTSTSAQSSPALQHSPIERITVSAPSSPAMKAPLQSLQRRLLHRHSSPSKSPTKDSEAAKTKRRGLFKRFSGGNRMEVMTTTAKGSRSLSLEEREAQKKKSIEEQQVRDFKMVLFRVDIILTNWQLSSVSVNLKYCETIKGLWQEAYTFGW